MSKYIYKVFCKGVGDSDGFFEVLEKGEELEKLDLPAKAMVSVDDIDAAYARTSNLHQFYKAIKELAYDARFLSTGLRFRDWDMLSNLTYVRVLYGDDEIVRYLSDIFPTTKKLKLLPDKDNVERANKKIPDGIKVEYTWRNGSKEIATTPKYMQGNWTHYRIMGE